jgi:hypothetical protein
MENLNFSKKLETTKRIAVSIKILSNSIQRKKRCGEKSIGEFDLIDLNFNKSIGKTILRKTRKAVVEPLDRT